MRIISIYLVLLGWTAAFSLPNLPVPRIISFVILLMSMLLIFRVKMIRILDKRLMILFYLFILSLVVSYIFQIINIGPSFTGFGHTFLFISIIILYFVVILVAISLTEYPTSKMYKYISWGVLFVSLITIIEFILKNFLNIDIDFMKIGIDNPATYSISGERFYRARGTTTESGHLAMYLLMFAPFIYHYQMNINKSKIKTTLCLLIVTFAVLFTFSAAGFVEFSVALLFILGISIIRWIKKGFKLSKVVLVYPVIFVFVSFVFYYFVYGQGNLTFLTGIFNKITFENPAVSEGNTRLSRWYNGWVIFKESPIIGHGSGIASIEHGTGSTNLYLDILAGGGVVGFLLFLFVLVYHLNLIFKIKGQIKYIYLISFTTMAIHYAIISNYWYPWMWMLLVMINVHYYRQLEISTKVNSTYRTKCHQSDGLKLN